MLYGSTRNGTPNPYELDLVTGLPPGTDFVEQLNQKPRYASDALTKNESKAAPSLPPLAERTGKWISRYLERLDPNTDYDAIIHMHMFYRLDPFQVALGYNSMFTQLVQTPAGADAVYLGKSLNKVHQRYYETVYYFLKWAKAGANAPETIRGIQQVNQMHKAAWARAPGSGHFAWEAQMAIIVLSYFEDFVRKTVGASCDTVPSQVREAWPLWSAQLTQHFATEEGAVLPNFGVNYPRTWAEVEAFYWWWEDYPFEESATDEQKQRAHEVTQTFQRQFCELFFPAGLEWLGGQVFKTFVPPKCRDRTRLGHPNPIMSRIIKFGVWAQITVLDLLPDPKVAPMDALYQDMQSHKSFGDIDASIRRSRNSILYNFCLIFGVLSVLVAFVCLRPFM